MWQEYQGRTVGSMLERSVQRWPDATALLIDDDVVTYRELYAGACAARRALRAVGIEPGDHVATLMGLGLRWVELYFAALSLDVRLVPLSLVSTPSELADGMRRSDCTRLVVETTYRGEDLLPRVVQALGVEDGGGDGTRVDRAVPTMRSVAVLAAEGSTAPVPAWAASYDEALGSARRDVAADVDGHGVGTLVDDESPRADAVALMLLTSGSTSFPKAVQLTHEAVLAGVATYADGLEVRPADVYVNCAPNYHVAGILTMSIPLLRGATGRLMRWFDPEAAMRWIEHDQGTIFWGFDTHFAMMREHPSYGRYRLDSVTRTMAASNPAACDRIRAMGFSHHGSIYGSTEYMGAQSFFPFADLDDIERMRSSHGRMTTAEIVIKDVATGDVLPAGELGEICARGPALFSGYYNLPEETAACMDEDGFFHSGDRGFLDADGYLYYRGRYMEMIKSGGENVSILEVEQFLETRVEGVRRALVCAAPDAKWGEAVTAMIELEPGVEMTQEQLVDACRGELAGFKIPKHVVFLRAEDWLVTPTGKFQRNDLRTLALSRLGLEA